MATSGGAKKIEKFAEAVDAASKHLIDAFQHPLEANDKLDEASRNNIKAWQAKNQVLTKVIKGINRTMAAVSLVEPTLHQFATWYEAEDMLTVLKKKFVDADLDWPPQLTQQTMTCWKISFCMTCCAFIPRRTSR